MANLNKASKKGDWRAEITGHKLVLAHEVSRYQGKEYHTFKGSIMDGSTTYLIEISCDANGGIQKYESKKDGKQLIYGRLAKLIRLGGGGSRA